MTLTAKTYGDGRGMITSAWLPTKWFVIASAILNSNTTVITLIVTPCVHWKVQNYIKNWYFIYHGWCLCKTGGGDNTGGAAAAVGAKLLPGYPVNSSRDPCACCRGTDSLRHFTTCTAGWQAGLHPPFSSSLALVPAAGSGPPQCVLQMASAPVWRKAMQHYTLLIVCLVLTCLWTRSLLLLKRAQQQDVKLLPKKLDRIKWLQHRIGCNNIHIPVLPDDWCSINISIHLNILVPSLHP